MPDEDDSWKGFRGPCAGGPYHGQNIVKESQTFGVPFKRNMDAPPENGLYRYNKTVGMFIWNGPNSIGPDNIYKPED